MVTKGVYESANKLLFQAGEIVEQVEDALRESVPLIINFIRHLMN